MGLTSASDFQRPIRFVSIVALALLVTGSAHPGQRDAPKLLGDSVAEAWVPDPSVPHPTPHPTDEQRRQIQQSIDESISLLAAQGKLPEQALAPPLLGWPLSPRNGLMDFGYHATPSFVDLDPAFPGSVLDYSCGTRTFDLPSGYNHPGVDYSLWPFPWNKMDSEQVAVVAAAPGTIVFKHDGEFDRSCSLNNNPWNAVYVRHADGSVAWYGQLKRNSVTSKSVGATVAQGEYLGIVGSSGSSTSPHLHFEVHDSLGNIVEPHTGPCQPAPSLWASQRPYFDSAINKLTTGSMQPVISPMCPNPSFPNSATSFTPPVIIYFTAYYRDHRSPTQDPTGSTLFTLYYPDGSEVFHFSHNSDKDHYVAVAWIWTLLFESGVDLGVYRWEMIYKGVRYDHRFSVGSGPFPAGAVPGEAVSGTPLEVTQTPGGDLALSWGASCNAGDSDYSVYEGTIGSYYSHQRKLCSTGGMTSVTFTPAAGDTYYLVVPNNGMWEGSYGANDAGAERPQAPFACLPQSLGVCM